MISEQQTAISFYERGGRGILTIFPRKTMEYVDPQNVIWKTVGPSYVIWCPLQ